MRISNGPWTWSCNATTSPRTTKMRCIMSPDSFICFLSANSSQGSFNANVDTLSTMDGYNYLIRVHILAPWFSLGLKLKDLHNSADNMKTNHRLNALRNSSCGTARQRDVGKPRRNQLKKDGKGAVWIALHASSETALQQWVFATDARRCETYKWMNR